MAEEPVAPRAFYPQGGERRRYADAEGTKPGGRALPGPRQAGRCPGAILDSDPSGSGLGIWLLVEEDEDSCTYEYGGGIA